MKHSWEVVPVKLRPEHLRPVRLMRCRQCLCSKFTVTQGVRRMFESYWIDLAGRYRRFNRVPSCKPVEVPLGG